LQLEALEDRAVPTIVFTPHFGVETIAQGSTNDGMQHPTVDVIFSGSYWNSKPGLQDRTTLLNSTQSILSGPYLSGLTQYGSDGTAIFGKSWTDTATVPSNPTASALQSFLQTSITRNSAFPGGNDAQHAPIYIVVSDPASSAQYNGGWNAPRFYERLVNFEPAGLEKIHMVWIGTSSTVNGTVVFKDAYTLTLSHELAETISDPDVHGIQVNPPSSLPTSLLSPGGNQVGDFEPEPDGGKHYGYRLNNDLVQPYWSNQDSAFIVPDGNSQKFYLDPIWNNTTFTGAYNLRVMGDQLGVNYADTIRIDGTSNVSVSMNNQAAVFDPGDISNVKVDTGGGSNTVRVAAVPLDVDVHIDSSGLSTDQVIVGSDGESLAGIQGTVTVSNTSGQTKLTIDALNDPAGTVVINDRAVVFGGILPTINFTSGTRAKDGSLHGVTELDVIDGKGRNSVSFFNVPDLTSVILYADTQDIINGVAAPHVTVIRNHS
jgi:hypothetical protein